MWGMLIMGKVWVTADQHFNHGNIIEYENRPFSDVEQMNKFLIEAWNSTVTKDDKVIVLGDFGFGGSDFIRDTLDRLKGSKILIRGNHDQSRSIKKWIELGFQSVYDYPVIYDTYYILSHAPLATLTECGHFYNVFGHVHGNPAIDTVTKSGFCVSVERHQYKPVLWQDIKNTLKR